MLAFSKTVASLPIPSARCVNCDHLILICRLQRGVPDGDSAISTKEIRGVAGGDPEITLVLR